MQLKKDEATKIPRPLPECCKPSTGHADSVYVMTLENGKDIAGMGGLMGTAMSARYSGAVIDGGVRDVAYLRKIGFPVFAIGIVPSTSVHHYRFAGSQIPLLCDGVEVKPGDIIVADTDGVVVVPDRRPKRSCRGSKNGFQRALHVCLDRKIEIDHRSREKVRAAVLTGIVPLQESRVFRR